MIRVFAPFISHYAVFQSAFTCFRSMACPFHSLRKLSHGTLSAMRTGSTHPYISIKRACGPATRPNHDNAYHNYQYHPFPFYSHCLLLFPADADPSVKSVSVLLTTSAACVHIFTYSYRNPSCTTEDQYTSALTAR